MSPKSAIRRPLPARQYVTAETLIDIQSVLRGDAIPANFACLVSLLTRDYSQASRRVKT